MKFRESLISAHHNYLVNQMLTPGFLLGDPFSNEGFFFLADVVLPGTDEPRIHGRLYDEKGNLLVRIAENRILEDPSRCGYQPSPGGFKIFLESGTPLLSLQTRSFANGYLTTIQAKLCDELGRLRMEPSYEGIQVHGEANLSLSAPLMK